MTAAGLPMAVRRSQPEKENSDMPTISMFYGIVIRLYFAPGEHNPPHFHTF